MCVCVCVLEFYDKLFGRFSYKICGVHYHIYIHKSICNIVPSCSHIFSDLGHSLYHSKLHSNKE